MDPELAKVVLKVDRGRVRDRDELALQTRPEVQAVLFRLQRLVRDLDQAYVVRCGQPTVATGVERGECLRRGPARAALAEDERRDGVVGGQDGDVRWGLDLGDEEVVRRTGRTELGDGTRERDFIPDGDLRKDGLRGREDLEAVRDADVF